MKKKWLFKSLSDVCEFERGLTYAKTDEVDLSSNIILRANNIDLNTNQLDFKDLRYINDSFVIPRSKKIKKHSLLICTASGSKNHLGKVAYIDDDYDFAFGGFMGMLTPKDCLLPRYIFYLMISDNYKKFIAALSDGANINNLKFSDLGRFSVPIPSLSEQLYIVAILDKVFNSIATAKANAERNLHNVHSLFESHLQAVFTDHKKNCVYKRLPAVAIDFGRGKSKHRPRNDPKLYGGEYPFIQTGDIRKSDHLITSYSQTYNDIGLAQSKLWPKGTLCITIAANIAETGILDFDACFPDSVIGVVVNEQITSNRFLEYLLQSFKAHLQAQGKGSAQDNINLGTFENQEFPFPDIAEQYSILEILDALREKTRLLKFIYQQKIAALDELKQSILHQAFTGQL